MATAAVVASIAWVEWRSRPEAAIIPAHSAGRAQEILLFVSTAASSPMGTVSFAQFVLDFKN
jgi:hypothetical protein